MSDDVQMPAAADEVESSLMIWQVYAERLEALLCRLGFHLPELPTEDEAMDVLLAEDDRYAALAEEFMAREYPWLTPEATQAFHAVAEQHGAQRSHELQRLIEAANLADAGQTIDTTGMTDEQFMAGLQGDLTCAGFFETATNLKLLDSDGDVGC